MADSKKTMSFSISEVPSESATQVYALFHLMGTVNIHSNGNGRSLAHITLNANTPMHIATMKSAIFKMLSERGVRDEKGQPLSAL